MVTIQFYRHQLHARITILAAMTHFSAIKINKVILLFYPPRLALIIMFYQVYISQSAQMNVLINI